MALQAQQIVTLATQIAGVPGFTSQAGQLLNVILSDLCQTYDFDVAKKTATLTLGSDFGPYALPSDYLRAKNGDVFYTYNSTPYSLVPIDYAEFDMFVKQQGLNSMPAYFATDMSQAPPNLYVWPPASGTFPLTVRYFAQMPDITTPETSTSVPWFPNQDYLVTRLAGEVMKIADDDRAGGYLGDGAGGAQGILRRYLNLKDDKSTRTEFVKLDRRRFGNRFDSVKNTKTIGF